MFSAHVRLLSHDHIRFRDHRRISDLYHLRSSLGLAARQVREWFDIGQCEEIDDRRCNLLPSPASSLLESKSNRNQVQG